MPDTQTDDERLDELATDREQFAAELAETFDLMQVLRLLRAMELRPSDLALAFDVHPRTVRSWFEGSDRGPDRQRDAILSLKAVVLFLLRRGILKPKQLTLWLMEPNEALDFRRPLAVLPEGRLADVLKASAPFTQPPPASDHQPQKRPLSPPGGRALQEAEGETRP